MKNVEVNYELRKEEKENERLELYKEKIEKLIRKEDE